MKIPGLGISSFARARFRVVAWGLSKLLWLQARRYAAFRTLLAKHDLTAQIRLADGSLGRYFVFQGGKVSSRRGLHLQPDVVMRFRDTAVAARILRPTRDRLEFLNAARTSQLELSGPGPLVTHFSNALTGLFLEFESSSLKRFDPDDPERPAIMTYRESWEGPHTTGLFARYPLQLLSPDPRFSFHTHHDAKHGALNDIAEHRVLIDGHHYWIARLHRTDAEARGIRENDLVRLFNDRGGVICAARLTERVRPGVVHSYESSAIYEPLGAPGLSDDRGGCVNILTPSRMMIERSHSMAANSCLIEVEKWAPDPVRPADAVRAAGAAGPVGAGSPSDAGW